MKPMQRLALLAVALLACAYGNAQSRQDIVLVPKQVSAHGWFFEGDVTAPL